MSRRKSRLRASARERARVEATRQLAHLARRAPGGTPERAIAIVSPAQVEVMAAAQPCAFCGGSVRVDEHVARTSGGVRVRVAHVACTACGLRRAVYFALREVLH